MYPWAIVAAFQGEYRLALLTHWLRSSLETVLASHLVPSDVISSGGALIRSLISWRLSCSFWPISCRSHSGRMDSNSFHAHLICITPGKYYAPPIPNRPAAQKISGSVSTAG
jgi:hypothetical protein